MDSDNRLARRVRAALTYATLVLVAVSLAACGWASTHDGSGNSDTDDSANDPDATDDTMGVDDSGGEESPSAPTAARPNLSVEQPRTVVLFVGSPGPSGYDAFWISSVTALVGQAPFDHWTEVSFPTFEHDSSLDLDFGSAAALPPNEIVVAVNAYYSKSVFASTAPSQKGIPSGWEGHSAGHLLLKHTLGVADWEVVVDNRSNSTRPNIVQMEMIDSENISVAIREDTQSCTIYPFPQCDVFFFQAGFGTSNLTLGSLDVRLWIPWASAVSDFSERNGAATVLVNDIVPRHSDGPNNSWQTWWVPFGTYRKVWTEGPGKGWLFLELDVFNEDFGNGTFVRVDGTQIHRSRLPDACDAGRYVYYSPVTANDGTPIVGAPSLGYAYLEGDTWKCRSVPGLDAYSSVLSAADKDTIVFDDPLSVYERGDLILLDDPSDNSDLRIIDALILGNPADDRR